MAKALLSIVISVILFALGGQIEIPLGNVPFILTDFFVFLAAFLLTWKQFLASTTLFLILGIIGLPVFAGGAGGHEHLTGATGGYLIGYLIGGLLVSILKTKVKYKASSLFLVFTGYYILFSIGISWLARFVGFETAINEGFNPFIFSMHFKGFVAWLIYISNIVKLNPTQSI